MVITCDPAIRLETRMQMLADAFTRQVRDGSLVAVESWDIANGRIEFIVRDTSE